MVEIPFHYTLPRYKSARALGRKNMWELCAWGDHLQGSWCAVSLKVENGLESVSQSCQRCRCWSIAVLASIVLKDTNQGPCHKLVTVLPLCFPKQSVGLVEVDGNWLRKSINLSKSRRGFRLFLPGLASRVVRLMRNRLSSMARGVLEMWMGLGYLLGNFLITLVFGKFQKLFGSLGVGSLQ